jgi:hypothetical protein
MKPRRSLKANPLHPLRGQTLHPIAKLSQRYRPTSLGIEARVFEAKLGAKLGGTVLDCTGARGFWRACRAFQIERFFGHARHSTARGSANSVPSKAR